MAVAAGIMAGGSILSSLFSGRRKETRTQKQKRKLVDELLISLKGGGQFGDLFNMDEDAFQKSYIDPAKSRFKNQIAPQIQQSFISSGQQRGTGLDDTLTRAGVDMDQLLNEQYMKFQQGKESNKINAINQILGLGDGAEASQSTGDKLQSGVAGYLSSDSFEDSIGNILNSRSKKGLGNDNLMNKFDEMERKGFAL